MDKIAKTKRAMRLQEWSEMYRAYQASGKTVSAWCEEQELSPKTFYYRLRKIRESALKCSEKHEVVPQVYLVCGYTDMRRGIDGLAAIVQQNYRL